MSVLRYDVTLQEWVIFAPERARRPHSQNRVEKEATRAPDEACPFCPGSEHLSPHEIFALRDRPNGGWSVRVIPNKYPALRVEEDPSRFEEHGLFREMAGCGAHEVVIESPDHAMFLGHQPVAQIERVLRTLQSRMNDLMQDVRLQSVILFKNHGEKAGTSLSHPHWQVIATPVVPHLLRLKHSVATEYFDATGHCIYCVLLEQELAEGSRVLATNDQFAAVLPYASHEPFETRILPRRHESSFGRVPSKDLWPLAELLKDVLSRLHAGLQNPDFNLVINTVARGDEGKRYFLWHVEILPRLSTTAGFEMGSGMSINTVLPEDAAKFLREVPLGSSAGSTALRTPG
jgi:UDPglucose--hexose-1-phosphate uridylyltransferase